MSRKAGAPIARRRKGHSKRLPVARNRGKRVLEVEKPPPRSFDGPREELRIVRMDSFEGESIDVKIRAAGFGDRPGEWDWNDERDYSYFIILFDGTEGGTYFDGAYRSYDEAKYYCPRAR